MSKTRLPFFPILQHYERLNRIYLPEPKILEKLLCPRFNTWWLFSYFLFILVSLKKRLAIVSRAFLYAIQLFEMNKYWKKFSIHISVRTFTFMCMRMYRMSTDDTTVAWINCHNTWFGMHIHSCLAKHRDIYTVLHEIDIFSVFFFFSLSISDSHQPNLRPAFVHLLQTGSY